ncbi:GNAT family N-acetyltransferase [uncultured Draconibacterium sp.]|uniref:GNAT family N-acetyltransferase n=1 Tax=uncultured Draconibacterium sp. TaxID=1573823 RepID=UPI0029C8C5E2|nr:GNAT family N-acetyltransferase [uncultured Draconibacterium sp.]
MKIRRYKPGEEIQLMEVFISSVRENAANYYSQEQLKAWAPNSIDHEEWENKMNRINPFVILDNDIIVGYADLQLSGYIDHFFVRGGYSGRGIGKQLMNFLLQKANENEITELSSDVSLAAQPFFKKFGFKTILRKKVEIRGVVLENASMKKNMLINGN